MKTKVLFICGSLNQTTMMHKIAMELPECECYFTPFYTDGILQKMAEESLLEFCILGGQFKQATLNYLAVNNLYIDYKGKDRAYDLVFTCTDVLTQKNIKGKSVVLVQEGMTDPENLLYYAARYLHLPRFIAGTALTGLSHAYDAFCVASEGYRDLFIRKGVAPERIRVTGIPNYDNCVEYHYNNFPHHGHVLVATSDSRETFKYENRRAFIRKALAIANGKKLIFKLHPNENAGRATDEIQELVPDALVYAQGNIHEMIANCDVLITKYSTVVYTGIALGKEVYSAFNLEELRRLTPLQNAGTSAKQIALVGLELLAAKNRNNSSTQGKPITKIYPLRGIYARS